MSRPIYLKAQKSIWCQPTTPTTLTTTTARGCTRLWSGRQNSFVLGKAFLQQTFFARSSWFT